MDKSAAYARITSSVLEFTTRFFHKRGFVQLMPVILSTTTDPLGPDPGSSVIKTGEIEYLGQRLVLTQSMILHKQVAVKSGIEKIFIISPNVRLESPARKDSGRHLFEFSQVDFEISHGKMADVFALMEDYLPAMADYVRLHEADALAVLGRELPRIKSPFQRYTTEELAQMYGADWEAKVSADSVQPFWAISHKREFYDKEDPQKPGTYLNYDLVYPEGFGEALSGAEREHEYSTIVGKIDRNGLDKSRYTKYLEVAKDGLVPSAGAGFGVERLVRFLAGAKHVGDVQMFPRIPGVAVAL